jgi:hypothetical protein
MGGTGNATTSDGTRNGDWYVFSVNWGTTPPTLGPRNKSHFGPIYSRTIASVTDGLSNTIAASEGTIGHLQARRYAGPRPCSSVFVDRENNLGKRRSADYNRWQSVVVGDEYPGGSWEPRRAVRSSRLTRMEQALWAARPSRPTVR